jgi:UDP-glucose 4-epimerase
VLQLADEVARAFGTERCIVHLQARNEVVHAFSSHEKVARYFGSKPFVTLRDGVSRMAEWAKSRGPTQPIVFKNIEIRKGLPPSWNL